MILTDKCKKDFDTWFIELKLQWFEDTEVSKDNALKSACGSLVKFMMNQNFSMQYGVYVDFFDSVNLCIELQHSYDWNYFITNQYRCETDYDFKTRHEARTEVIKKANEIYNESK
jgi:hypothetical protein